MIQLCGKSIVKPSKYLSYSSLTAGIFPQDWKKGSIIGVCKKETKNCSKNDGLISLFLTFSKIFERLIFKALFNFFVQNRLLTDCQSGFIPVDSCISHYR